MSNSLAARCPFFSVWEAIPTTSSFVPRHFMELARCSRAANCEPIIPKRTFSTYCLHQKRHSSVLGYGSLVTGHSLTHRNCPVNLYPRVFPAKSRPVKILTLLMV